MKRIRHQCQCLNSEQQQQQQKQEKGIHILWFFIVTPSNMKEKNQYHSNIFMHTPHTNEIWVTENERNVFCYEPPIRTVYIGFWMCTEKKRGKPLEIIGLWMEKTQSFNVKWMVVEDWRAQKKVFIWIFFLPQRTFTVSTQFAVSVVSSANIHFFSERNWMKIKITILWAW